MNSSIGKVDAKLWIDAPQTPSPALLCPMLVEAKASSPHSAGAQPSSLPTWIFVFLQRPPHPVWRKRRIHPEPGKRTSNWTCGEMYPITLQ